MLRKIIFGIVISIIVIGGIYWFIYTKEARTPISDGINAIPSDAAIIFESKHAKSTWKKLSQTNIMWEELLGTQAISEINQQGKLIDSILEINPEISELLDNHSIFISVHNTSTDNLDLLYVYSLPNLTYKNSVENFLKEKIHYMKIPITTSEFENETISKIPTSKTSSIFVSMPNGILIISGNQLLLEASIHQLKSGQSFANDKNFSKVINTAGKNVDANIYINYKKFPTLFNDFIFPTAKKEINSLVNFADYSGWDITIKPNALQLSGFTLASDSTNSFLNLFSKQKPQEVELTKIIPSKTATMLFFGISNIKSFQLDYKNYLASKRLMLEKNQVQLLTIII